jgi:hypothetical protein
LRFTFSAYRVSRIADHARFVRFAQNTHTQHALSIYNLRSYAFEPPRRQDRKENLLFSFAPFVSLR